MSWTVTGNSYVDQSGERIRTPGWRAYRKLAPLVMYSLEISPRRWRGKVIMNGLEYVVPTTHPSHHSITSALHWADKALTPPVWQAALAYFFSHHLATCIATATGEPFFTAFGQPKWAIFTGRHGLPRGKYLLADRRQGRLCYDTLELNGYGYSLGFGALVQFEHWLEEL